jgi:hypothetical protein
MDVVAQVAGVPVPGSPDPIAATDVEDARWFPVDSLADLQGALAHKSAPIRQGKGCGRPISAPL